MDFDEVLAELRARGTEQIATIYGRQYPGVNAWGVKFGDMEALE